jgi:hypothetical protein
MLYVYIKFGLNVNNQKRKRNGRYLKITQDKIDFGSTINIKVYMLLNLHKY